MLAKYDIALFKKEQSEMLEKKNVGELVLFIEKWERKGLYEIGTSARVRSSNQLLQMTTLCKMICNVDDISKETKLWARNWLCSNGLKPTIKL